MIKYIGTYVISRSPFTCKIDFKINISAEYNSLKLTYFFKNCFIFNSSKRYCFLVLLQVDIWHSFTFSLLIFTVWETWGSFTPFLFCGRTLNRCVSLDFPLSKGMRGRGLTPGRLRETANMMGFIGYDGQNAPKNAWGLRQQLLLRKFKNEKWDENNGQSRDHSI